VGDVEARNPYEPSNIQQLSYFIAVLSNHILSIYGRTAPPCSLLWYKGRL